VGAVEIYLDRRDFAVKFGDRRASLGPLHPAYYIYRKNAIEGARSI